MFVGASNFKTEVSYTDFEVPLIFFSYTHIQLIISII